MYKSQNMLLVVLKVMNLLIVLPEKVAKYQKIVRITGILIMKRISILMIIIRLYLKLCILKKSIIITINLFTVDIGIILLKFLNIYK